MAFQGQEFTQGMKQLVVNLRQFYDIGRHRNNLKADRAAEQTAKGLNIGEATVRRIMTGYDRNRRHIPEDYPKARVRPEYSVPRESQTVVRHHICSQNLKGQHVSADLVREHLFSISPEFTFPLIW